MPSFNRVKRGEEWVDEPVFVDVTLWARTAEVANEFLSKGSPVLIEGRLKLESWEQEGQKRSRLKIIGERMQMLGRKSGKANGDVTTGQPVANGEVDVPF